VKGEFIKDIENLKTKQNKMTSLEIRSSLSEIKIQLKATPANWNK
jgi:hypothetical protein